MKKFDYQDVSDYYDQTENHYKMWWKLDKAMGLHYGVWDETTKTLSDAVLNLNKYLAKFGEIKGGERVLDAGCGIGGSSIYLAKHFRCRCTGVTLSQKQADTATQKAKENGVADLCDFKKVSYTETGFEDGTFDYAWAIESFGSAINKEDFFKEMNRLLKPGGKILMADTLKPKAYDIDKYPVMQDMLYGWAISDILSIQEVAELAEKYNFKIKVQYDAQENVEKSINMMYWACQFGKIGTKLYNLFKDATPFSKTHYKTGIAQKKAKQTRSLEILLVSD